MSALTPVKSILENGLNPGISPMQIYSYRNRHIVIDLTRIPSLSDQTKKALQTIGLKTPVTFSSSIPLMKRFKTLEITAEMLQTAKNNSVRNQAWGMLKTAFSIVLAAGIIVSVCKLEGGAQLGIGIGGLFSHVFLSSYFLFQGQKEVRKVQRLDPEEEAPCCFLVDETPHWTDMIVAAMGPGTILPAYEARTRIPRLAKVFQKQQQVLFSLLEQSRLHNTECLQTANRFYQVDSLQILNRIDQHIQQIQANWITPREPAAEPLRITEIMIQYKEQLKQAKTELTELRKFYQQFAIDQEESEAETSPVLKELEEEKALS